jgi:hypothetical protein
MSLPKPIILTPNEMAQATLECRKLRESLSKKIKEMERLAPEDLKILIK